MIRVNVGDGEFLKKILSVKQILKHTGKPVTWDPKQHSPFICKFYLALSRMLMCSLNKTHFANQEHLFDLIDHRKGRGLITVSNHKSRLDDPMMWAILTWRNTFNINKLRWTTAAADVCFTRQWHSYPMSWGKVVPLVRGEGVCQKPMDFCVKLLEAKEWLHIFPEGTINHHNENLRLKWGVGRLIADSNITPIVLPIHHVGFDSICLNKGLLTYIFRLFQKASVYVGQPLDFSSEVEKMRKLKLSKEEKWIKLTERVQQEMLKVKQEAELFHKMSHFRFKS